MKKGRLVFAAVAAALAAAGILCFPGQCAQGAKRGLSFCGNILIPSIFPFLVLSVFVVKSGVSKALSRLLDPVTKRLFRLPGSAGATVLIGLTGGYPSGARGIKALLDSGEITQKQARRMLCFTVGAGPAFVISVTGSGLLGSVQTGIILFISQLSAALVLGILVGLFARGEEAPAEARGGASSASMPVSSALVEAASDGASSMISMCSFVILFSALLVILDQSGISSFLKEVFSSFGLPDRIASSLVPVLLEVTTGSTAAAAAGAGAPFLSFALGWAGLCVDFQIFSMLRSVSFSKAVFLLFRLFHGLLSALFTVIGLHFLSDYRNRIFLYRAKSQRRISAAGGWRAASFAAVRGVLIVIAGKKCYNEKKEKISGAIACEKKIIWQPNICRLFLLRAWRKKQRRVLFLLARPRFIL